MKRTSLLAIIVIIISTMAFLFIKSYLRAFLTLTLNDEETVVIHKLDQDFSRVFSSDSPGDISIRLSRGTYSVTITRDDMASRSIVQLGIRQRQHIDLDLVSTEKYIKTSNQSTDYVGHINNRAYVLDKTRRSLVTIEGDLVNRNISNVAKVAFSSTNALTIDAFGTTGIIQEDGIFTTLGLGDDNVDPYDAFEVGSSTSSFGFVVSASFDTTSGNYCLLSNQNKVGWVDAANGNFTLAAELDSSIKLNEVKCRDGLVVVATVNQDFDGEVSFNKERVDIFSIDGASISSISSEIIGSLEVLPGKEVAYSKRGGIFKTSQSLEGEQIIFSNDRQDNTIIFAGGKLLVIANNEIWSLNDKEKTAHRILTFPDLSALSALSSNEKEIMFAISIGTHTGIYLSTTNNELYDEYRRLSGLLPIVKPDYTIKLSYNGNKIIIESTNTAPIPSSGVMDMFYQSEKSIKDTIDSLNIDSNYVTHISR